MPSELRVDLAGLRAAAALIPAPRPPALGPDDLDALAGLPGGGVLVAEHDRLVAAFTRAGRELAELTAALRAVAVAVELAEDEAVRSVAQT